MDALKIIFETGIIGVLALPWIALLINFFCPVKEVLVALGVNSSSDKTSPLVRAFKAVSDNTALTAIAGVFLLAMAYVVGSGVMRFAENFFNDDDLDFHAPWPTEDKIRAAVYCHPEQRWIAQPGLDLLGSSKDRKSEVDPNLCSTSVEKGGQDTRGDREAHGASSASWDAKEDPNELEKSLENKVRQEFSVEESALWLLGPDKTDRLRHLHQQVQILRGAALDGVITFSLCLFGFCKKQGSWGRLVLALLSLTLMAWGLYALGRHLGGLRPESSPVAGAPPLMEALLLVIAAIGIGMCVRPDKTSGSHYACGSIFTLLLTLLAFAGWWSTEILYNQTVIYFYFAAVNKLPS